MTLQSLFAQAATGAAQQKSVAVGCTIAIEAGNAYGLQPISVTGSVLYIPPRLQRIPPPGPTTKHIAPAWIVYPPLFEGAFYDDLSVVVDLILQGDGALPFEQLLGEPPHNRALIHWSSLQSPQLQIAASYVENEPPKTLVETPAAVSTDAVSLKLLSNNVTDFTITFEGLTFF